MHDQAARLDMMRQWFERTYPVDDPTAVAVLARKRKTGKPWTQDFFDLGTLFDSVEAGQATIPSVFDDELTDCYAGLTLYYKDWRCASTVRWIPMCFVDIDCYRKSVSNDYTDPVKLIPHIVEICHTEGIPEPTEFTFTGRGLLARWHLIDPIRAWPEKVATWK